MKSEYDEINVTIIDALHKIRDKEQKCVDNYETE